VRHSLAAGWTCSRPGPGGPTRTRALRAGSQAIGLGLAATCEQLTGPAGVADTDRRGSARRSAQRGVCDSGAFDTGG
jgi:hypothetical protein